MKYQSVAILGAGAVGSYVMWGLAKKKEIDLCVVASGERKARYERDGFVINGQVYHPAVRTPEEAAGVDLLIVATKYQALRRGTRRYSDCSRRTHDSDKSDEWRGQRGDYRRGY